MEESVQLQLVPDVPLDLFPIEVPLSALAYEEVQPATKQLIDSIRRFGLLQPILVRGTYVPGHNAAGEPEDFYEYAIVDGRRRLDVCRRLNIDPVPAMVAKTDLAIADVATLATNSTRTNNPIAEFHAIRRLTERGASEKEIAGATGMSRATIKARQSLLNLTPTLADAFAAGKMTATTAQNAAKLPKVLQGKLANILLVNDKVTERDLHDVRLAQQQTVMDGFDFGDVLDDAPATTADPSIDYLLAQEIRTVIERLPAGSERYVTALEWVALALVDRALGKDAPNDGLLMPWEIDE